MTNRYNCATSRESIALRDLKWLLPGDDWQIAPNQRGDLTVFSPSGKCVGYVTFNPECVHRFVPLEEV